MAFKKLKKTSFLLFFRLIQYFLDLYMYIIFDSILQLQLQVFLLSKLYIYYHHHYHCVYYFWIDRLRLAKSKGLTFFNKLNYVFHCCVELLLPSLLLSNK